MGKGRPYRQAGGTGEEGGAFRSLLGQPAFWAVISSFIKHCWYLLCVQPAAAFMSKIMLSEGFREGERTGRKEGRGREEQKE